MENKVKLKTCSVLGSLLANTVEAIKAAFVLREAWKVGRKCTSRSV